MFGTKVNRLQTRGSYTLEELFDAIKEERFTAGRPRFTHQGFSQVIVFPAIDVDNQVRVYNAALVSPSNQFFVQRDQQVGAIVGDDAIDDLHGVWRNSSRDAASNAELCDRLAEKTCRELDGLGL